MALATSVRPAPVRPASPTISPFRTWKRHVVYALRVEPSNLERDVILCVRRALGSNIPPDHCTDAFQ